MDNINNSKKLIIANEEIAFQNGEKDKRAIEYSILNEELID